MIVVLAMGLCCLSVLLAVPSPITARRRLDVATDTSRTPAWWAARPDALPTSVRRLGGIGAGVTVLVVAGWLPWWLLGPAAVFIGVSVFVLLGRLEPRSVRRRRAQLVADLPQAVELLAACLAAGAPLRTATAAVAEAMDGPLAEELNEVCVRLTIGMSDREAWSALADDRSLRQLARDIARASESGSALHEVLLVHAADARKNRWAQRQAAAKTVGVRTVLPLMVCFLPAFLLLGIVPTVGAMIVRVLGLR